MILQCMLCSIIALILSVTLYKPSVNFYKKQDRLINKLIFFVNTFLNYFVSAIIISILFQYKKHNEKF